MLYLGPFKMNWEIPNKKLGDEENFASKTAKSALFRTFDLIKNIRLTPRTVKKTLFVHCFSFY